MENIINENSKNPEIAFSLFSPKLPDIQFYTRYPEIGNSITENAVSLITPSNFQIFWRIRGMGKATAKANVQVFHGLSNELPIDLPKTIKSVVTIHDVLFREFPKQYSWLDRQTYHQKTKYALRKSDTVIATSQATKDAILKHYSNISANKIEVVYQSIQPVFSDLFNLNSAALKAYPLDVFINPEIQTFLESSPYIVYHSTFNHRKNHFRLLKSFYQVMDQVKCNLVLPGFSGRTLDEIRNFCQEKQLGSRVKLLGELTTETLVHVIKNASGFIYPSLNEGFGIPLAEACALRLPFMVSDIPVFKELLDGNEDFLFNPKDNDSMAKALIQLNEVSMSNSLKDKWSDLHKSVIDKTHPELVAKQLMQIYST